MEVMLLRMFQRQIDLQCKGAIVASNSASNSLVLGDGEGFWLHMQSFLTCVANISKALWGQGGTLAADREPLRQSLQVADDSPLRPTSMRNNFDHFDDRLDKWWADDPNHNFIQIIGPRNSIVGIPQDRIIRHFDPTTAELIFFGDSYPIDEIMQAITTLRTLAQAESQKPHWEPPTAAGADQ